MHTIIVNSDHELLLCCVLDENYLSTLVPQQHILTKTLALVATSISLKNSNPRTKPDEKDIKTYNFRRHLWGAKNTRAAEKCHHSARGDRQVLLSHSSQDKSYPFQFLTIPTSMFQFIVTFTMIPQCQFIVDEFVILGLVLCNSCNSNRNRCYWCNFLQFHCYACNYLQSCNSNTINV